MPTHVNSRMHVGMDEARTREADEPELVGIEAAATRLGISAWTVRRWVCDRKIASCKIGARRLIPVSEIARLISSGMESRDE